MKWVECFCEQCLYTIQETSVKVENIKRVGFLGY